MAFYSYTPAHLRPDTIVPPEPTVTVKPLRMRQRDDNYGPSAAPRIANRNMGGQSKQAGNRIGIRNNYL